MRDLLRPFGGTFSRLNEAALFALILAIVLPALIVSDPDGPQYGLGIRAWMAIASAIAFVCGIGMVRDRAPWWVGAISGMCAAPGAMLAIWFHTHALLFVFRVDVVLAFIVGVMPAIGFYWVAFVLAAPTVKADRHE